MIWGGAYNKALVSLIMSILLILDEWFGVSFPGLSEQWIITLLAVLSPILVWMTPNK